MDLTVMTPAEVDAEWAKAVAPANAQFERAAAKLAAASKNRSYGGRYVEVADKYDAQAQEMFAKAREMRDAVEPPFNAEWDRRGGWTRAYIVPGGHIHKSRQCHTLYPTTLVGWVPEMSGHSEDEIVTYAGVNACTVCYPSAPVDALRAAAAAEKAKDLCPGSGTWDHDSSGLRYAQRRARCNHCGQTVSCTSTGKMRQHKPKVQS